MLPGHLDTVTTVYIVLKWFTIIVALGFVVVITVMFIFMVTYRLMLMMVLMVKKYDCHWTLILCLGDGQLIEGYHDVRSAIEDILTMIDEATVEIAYARRHIHNADVDVTEAEIALNQTETRLNEAEIYLNEDGRMAVEEAAEHQLHRGQQSENMTVMAQEARLITER